MGNQLLRPGCVLMPSHTRSYGMIVLEGTDMLVCDQAATRIPGPSVGTRANTQHMA